MPLDLSPNKITQNIDLDEAAARVGLSSHYEVKEHVRSNIATLTGHTMVANRVLSAIRL